MKDTKVDVDRLNREIFLMTRAQPGLLDEYLREDGFDPAQLEKNGIAKVKALLFKQKVALKKTEQESLYAKAMAVFESAQAATKEAILSLLRERAPQLQFNNLEKMEERDLREILNESDLLDLMDKIAKNEL
jgi:hypothetical protein